MLSSKWLKLKILCGELAQKCCGEFAPTRREMPLNSKICEVKKVLRRIGAKIVRRVCVNSPRRLSAVSSDLQNEQKCAASWRKNSAASLRQLACGESARCHINSMSEFSCPSFINYLIVHTVSVN